MTESLDKLKAAMLESFRRITLNLRMTTYDGACVDAVIAELERQLAASETLSEWREVACEAVGGE